MAAPYRVVLLRSCRWLSRQHCGAYGTEPQAPWAEGLVVWHVGQGRPHPHGQPLAVDIVQPAKEASSLQTIHQHQHHPPGSTLNQPRSPHTFHIYREYFHHLASALHRPAQNARLNARSRQCRLHRLQRLWPEGAGEEEESPPCESVTSI